MNRILFLAIILTFFFAPDVKADEVTLTLNEAISIALRDNRDILISKNAIEKAKLDTREALADALPQITATASRDFTQDLQPERYYTTEIHAGLKQTFFASGRIVNNIKYNEYKTQVQQALLDKEQLDLILKIKTAFCTLILASELSLLNKDVMENAKLHFDFIQSRYEKGQASESDLLSAKTSLDTATKNCIDSLGQAESAQILLRDLLYMDNSITINPVGRFAYEPKEIAYDKMLLNAMSKRPEIRQYEAQLKADEKNIDVTRAATLPTVYGTVDVYSGRRFITTTGISANKWRNYEVLGITVSWPVFDGFATQAKMEQAIVDLKNSRLLRDKAIRDIAAELKSAYVALKTAVAALEAAESDIKFYDDNLNAVTDKYKSGITSTLDINDAQLKYNIAHFNKEQALYDYIIAKSSFEKAAGGYNEI